MQDRSASELMTIALGLLVRMSTTEAEHSMARSWNSSQSLTSAGTASDIEQLLQWLSVVLDRGLSLTPNSYDPKVLALQILSTQQFCKLASDRVSTSKAAIKLVTHILFGTISTLFSDAKQAMHLEAAGKQNDQDLEDVKQEVHVSNLWKALLGNLFQKLLSELKLPTFDALDGGWPLKKNQKRWLPTPVCRYVYQSSLHSLIHPSIATHTNHPSDHILLWTKIGYSCRIRPSLM